MTVPIKCSSCGGEWVPLKKDFLPLLTWCPRCRKDGPFAKSVEEAKKMAATPSLNEQVARAMGVSAGKWHDNEGQQFEAGWPDYEGDWSLHWQVSDWLTKHTSKWDLLYSQEHDGYRGIALLVDSNGRDGIVQTERWLPTELKCRCRLVLAVHDAMKGASNGVE